MAEAWRAPAWAASLRARLLLALLALMGVSASVTGGASYWRALQQSEAQFDYQLMQMALSLRDHGEVADTRALADARLDFVVQIWSADGRHIYSSREHEQWPDQAVLGYADVQVGTQTWRTFGAATPLRVIQVAQPLAVRQRMATAAALQALVPVLGVALLLLLAGWWMIRYLLQPLELLAQHLRGRQADSLQKMSDANLPLELRPLVLALNDLLGRLQAAWAAQRQFVADAAHELRSPLTALKLQLHVLGLQSQTQIASNFEAPDAYSTMATSQKDQKNPSTDETLPSLATLADTVQRMSHLVEQLLLLARSEDAAAPHSTEPVDLAEVSRAQLTEVAALAHARSARLSLQASAPVWVHGQPLALASLLRNLLDNALLHNPPGVQVQVVVQPGRPGGPGVQWLVQDSGGGIAPAERERVFDRFYRASGPDVPGSGLGLAIVRAIAQRHGAQVLLGDCGMGGLQVAVQWPASSGNQSQRAPVAGALAQAGADDLATVGQRR
jgi:two-component system OmpR family sensor kinase/two-component system sensor histidine kinase QseC